MKKPVTVFSEGAFLAANMVMGMTGQMIVIVMHNSYLHLVF